MFIDLLLESCEEVEEFLCWVMQMSQYFKDKVIQISLNFWLSYRNASFLLAIFGKFMLGNYCDDY